MVAMLWMVGVVLVVELKWERENVNNNIEYSCVTHNLKRRAHKTRLIKAN